MSEHLSQDPTKLEAIYDKMMGVMNGVSSGTMSIDEGETTAKAGHVACKTVEVDLHARMFARKVEGSAARVAGDAAQQALAAE